MRKSNYPPYQTLTQAVEELERTDPAVAKAKRGYEQARDEILAGGSYRQRARRAIAERKAHAGK